MIVVPELCYSVMIRYDEHAEFQIKRRSIAKAWVEETISSPDAVDRRGVRMSFLKCLPGRRFMLRVVTPQDDSGYVITAYFDRTKPCV